MDEIIVVSVGGSLIVPSEIDVDFLKSLREFVLKWTEKGKRFIIICGGGKTARNYQNAARGVIDLDNEDADWIGIHSTRLNAHLVRTIFRDVANPVIVKNPNDEIDFKEKVLVAAGWRPGCSTDYDAVLIAKNFNVRKLVNLSNIDYVYDKDPKKFEDAQILKEISWDKLIGMLPDKWDPGLNAPFDPIAAREARALDLDVVILNGKNFERFDDYLNGKEFIGSLIKSHP